MEKVVIISDSGTIGYRSEDKVNIYLEQGWSVKNIHTAVAENYTTIIFVLEK